MYSYQDLKSLINESVALYQAEISAGSTEMHTLMRGCQDLLGVAPAAEVHPHSDLPNASLLEIELHLHAATIGSNPWACISSLFANFLCPLVWAAMESPSNDEACPT